jgi:hypothetical protein
MLVSVCLSVLLRACGASQVRLLDPVQYPASIKAFAREVCRNDLLNFGRLHFFFPDSRLALDLNTDKTLKARAPSEPVLVECHAPGWADSVSPPGVELSL